jgi:hypothetical protein
MEMAHGYLGDGYGIHGDFDDRDEHRDRQWRERSWRGHDDDWRSRDRGHDRDRGMMFGGSRDDWRERGSNWSDEGRGRWGAQGRERGGNDWFRDEMGSNRSRGFGSSGGRSEDRRSFSAHPDDHFRSWRDRHMSEIDRDYQDYCREREDQFHREFDDWRRQKYGNPQPLRTGMTQSGISHDPSGETQAVEEGTGSTPVASDPTATATLGTNSGGGGRSRR